MAWLDYYQRTETAPQRRVVTRALQIFQDQDRRQSGSGQPDLATTGPAGQPSDTRRFAIDLGAGSGRETLPLLADGWHVLAIDSEPTALTRLRARALEQGLDARLQTLCARFEDLGMAAQSTGSAHDRQGWGRSILYSARHIGTQLFTGRARGRRPSQQQAAVITNPPQLPPADLIISCFALPLCAPESFDRLWQEIGRALAQAPGGMGVFAGHLYGNRDSWATPPAVKSAEPKRPQDPITVHTRSQALALLQDCQLTYFSEEENDGRTAQGQEKHWHVFHTTGIWKPESGGNT